MKKVRVYEVPERERPPEFQMPRKTVIKCCQRKKVVVTKGFLVFIIKEGIC